ncbi:MAG: alpha-galactosidase [Candidatus Latescibacteria bacterium]|nr:alpha-galactosidase [Candidatus Latescibacterota bacterium]
MNKKLFRISVILLSGLLLFSPSGCSQPGHLRDGGPPIEPAEVTFDGGELVMTYHDSVIFSGHVGTSGEVFFNDLHTDQNGVISQVVVLESKDLQTPITVTAEVIGSEESFPCEVDRKRSGFNIVRHSSGLSRSLLNRAVYDRKSDWVLSVDIPVRAAVTPTATGERENRFTMEISGPKIVLRFRPRYYQRHRGLYCFEPWTYRVWDQSVAGWCSWFAYFSEIDEEKMRCAADIFSEWLLPFGYRYFQMDDGYQQEPGGLPETWLQPNEKFPGGLDALCRYISSRGLEPGIWTYASFHRKDFVESNRDMFVLDEAGNPAHGMWVGYVMDASNPRTLEEIVRPLYRGLREMGWTYFKVDALRHLRYEGYNSYYQHFEARGMDRVEVFRTFARTIREEIGEDSFMLGCWGIRPELIGIIDGCRIGGDGFGYAGLAQYNSFNNVIWRNDPDHVELTEEEAYRSCMVTSLTGSLLMLTDRPERYETDLVEPARRAAPVLFTRPGQIYDVDPSRSMHLDQVDTEVSGDGQRIFDADRSTGCDLFLLEINLDFENWVLLGRMGGEYERFPFRELGLDPQKEYLVFEFWSKRYLGSFSGSFPPGAIDPRYNCQLFCIREKLDRPQLVATSRHVSCGGLELRHVTWNGSALSGESDVVARDTYTLYISEPDGYIFQDFRCEGAGVAYNQRKGPVRTVRLLSDQSGTITWFARFEKGSG